MTTVFVVDEGAGGIAADLNAISKREKQDVRFDPILTVEQMFRALESEAPDLILLHHHWQGLTVSQVLERIAEQAGEARVIVFTGQSVDVGELIECVRLGVADYWTKRGQLEPLVVFRQIANYCSGSQWCLKTLRMASGSQRQLIREAQRSLVRIEELSKSKQELEGRVRVLQDREHLALWRAVGTGVKLAFTIAVLTAAFFVAYKRMAMPAWAALVFVAILALFFLLLEGKLAAALFKWKGGAASLKGK